MTGGGRLPDDPGFQRLRAELIPRGFLFHGPPGTGKTLFAKAVANRLNATIRVVSGPEVTDMYVGESERKVRAIFAEARRNAPSVVVFDEIDSVADATEGLNGDELRSLFRDACVGHWFEDPPQPIDPWQLGYLIGCLRTRLDAQRTGAVEPRPLPRRGERRGPSGGMIRHHRGGEPDGQAETAPAPSSSQPR
jgi:hypothetical protein